jgi:hypothetical protein
MGPEEDLMIDRVWLTAILFFAALLGAKALALAVDSIRNWRRRRQLAQGHRSGLVIDALGWSPPPVSESEDRGAEDADMLHGMNTGHSGILTISQAKELDDGEARVAAVLDILEAMDGDPAKDFTALHASIPDEGERPGRFNPNGLRSRIAAALQRRVWSSMEVGFLDLDEVPGRQGRLWDRRKAS